MDEGETEDGDEWGGSRDTVCVSCG